MKFHVKINAEVTMAVKIRLMRVGKRKQPYYRIVAKEARSPRQGRCIEQVGFYNPLVDPAEVRFDMEKVDKWLKDGAQPTDTVKRLLSKYANNPTQKEG
jgi:small subunit ribosomal protein S16